MRAVFDVRQKRHEPRHFMAGGLIKPNPEQAARIDALQSGARQAGCSFVFPADHGLGPIAAVHDAEYLSFLQTVHARWQRQVEASPEVIPNVHPRGRTDSYPRGVVGQAGWHMADTACPIGEHTWEAAYWSAQTALTAAECVASEARAAYALCRPPGHHAFGDMAGGFCFLNNSAIAANWLASLGNRVAILDVDVHHGNGTQGIFYERADVLTVSVHADPARFYPFYWGHAHERGAGAGLGANLNLPLARGTGDDGMLAALATALDRVAAFGTEVLVVALGLDAHENDPFQGLAVTTGGFAAMGALIAQAGLPVVFVQEGGYLSDDLGRNLAAVLGGFEAG